MCLTLNVKNLFNPKGGCMKKLLVLAMVLSMATIASAGLTVSITGPSQVDYGATAVFTLSYAGDIPILGSDVDLVPSVGTVGGGVIVIPVASPARTAALDILGANVITGDYQIGVMNDNSSTDLGSPIATFVYTAPLSGVGGAGASITLVENSFLDLTWSVVSGAVLENANFTLGTLVPEPITMTLLGLGGLFLRRRSK
jgi:hypothetical protein